MGDSEPLTEQQRRIVDFVRKCLMERRRAPTNAEGAEEMGFADTRAWRYHVEKLIERNVLRKVPGARGLEIVGEDLEFCIRVLGAVAAGEPIEPDAAEYEQLNLQRRFGRADVFFVKVVGDSMEGAHIIHGDFVAVKEDPDPPAGKIVVARIEGRFTLKRLSYRGKGDRREVILMPHNETCEPIRVREGQDAQIVGTFEGMVRLM